MRKYSLASTDAKRTVDLRDYSQLIEETVHEIIPEASVSVYETYYIVSPTPSRGDAIKIGRKLSSMELGKYCIQIPKLFTSRSIKENERDGKKTQHGGHY